MFLGKRQPVIQKVNIFKIVIKQILVNLTALFDTRKQKCFHKRCLKQFFQNISFLYSKNQRNVTEQHHMYYITQCHSKEIGRTETGDSTYKQQKSFVQGTRLQLFFLFSQKYKVSHVNPNSDFFHSFNNNKDILIKF